MHVDRYALLRRWPRPDIGALFLINGPSGVGKSTLVEALDKNIPSLVRSRSVTTRAPRENEQCTATNREFVTRATFGQLREDGRLLEYTSMHDEWYGTLREPILHDLQNRVSVIMEANNDGVDQVRAQIADAVSVFILPPSIDALRKRLADRETETAVQIEERMRAGLAEMQHCNTYDYIIMNNDFDVAYAELEAIVIAELARTSRRGSLAGSFVEALIRHS